MRPIALAAAMLLLCTDLSAFEPAAPFHEPNAVLLNISEADLNRIARDAFREHFGTTVEGATSDPSRGIRDLRYEATFSEPVLELDTEGGVRVDLDLVEAELRIGRIEHKFMRRMASCDGAGVNVDPDRPVEVGLEFRFEVEDHDLHIVPENVTVGNAKGFRLVKPTSCQKTGLPKWLVWWIGKGQLRRKINKLDELLLAKAQSGAAELSEGSGQQVVAPKFRFAAERLQGQDGLLGFGGVPKGDGPVQPDHRGRLHLQEQIVELENLLPVGAGKAGRA